jgi:hypothetical protein
MLKYQLRAEHPKNVVNKSESQKNSGNLQTWNFNDLKRSHANANSNKIIGNPISIINIIRIENNSNRITNEFRYLDFSNESVCE